MIAPRSPAFALGLTGSAGAGKSTIAAGIAVALGNIRPLHAGFVLKAMLGAFYSAQGVPDDMIRRKIDGDLKRDPCPYLCGKTPTEAQQTLGTEWGRDLIGSDIWLTAWTAEARRRIVAGEGVINDSVRFENEAAAIRALGGIVLRVEGRRDMRVSKSHKSESGVAADFILDNSSSVEASVRQAMNFIQGRIAGKIGPASSW